jgi:hypothetical protein
MQFFFKGLQVFCINTTPTLAYNMKSKNVHDFPTPIQQTKSMFSPFKFHFFIVVVREGKERK